MVQDQARTSVEQETIPLSVRLTLPDCLLFNKLVFEKFARQFLVSYNLVSSYRETRVRLRVNYSPFPHEAQHEAACPFLFLLCTFLSYVNWLLLLIVISFIRVHSPFGILSFQHGACFCIPNAKRTRWGGKNSRRRLICVWCYIMTTVSIASTAVLTISLCLGCFLGCSRLW